jgi:hypothetical protein
MRLEIFLSTVKQLNLLFYDHKPLKICLTFMLESRFIDLIGALICVRLCPANARINSYNRLRCVSILTSIRLTEAPIHFNYRVMQNLTSIHAVCTRGKVFFGN